MYSRTDWEEGGLRALLFLLSPVGQCYAFSTDCRRTVFSRSGWVRAGTIFRTAILLYGQRITPPEIVRWVRAG